MLRVNGVTYPDSPSNQEQPILIDYTTLKQLRDDSELMQGRNYFITDRDIQVRAFSTNLIEPRGVYYRTVSARGSFRVNSGNQGDILDVTVDGVDILGVAVPYNTSLAQTAADAAAQITAYAYTPFGATSAYRAFSKGKVVYIVAPKNLADSVNGFAVIVTVSTNPGDNLVADRFNSMGAAGQTPTPGIITGQILNNDIFYNFNDDIILTESDKHSNIIKGGFDSFPWGSFNVSIRVSGNTLLDECIIGAENNIGNIYNNFLANNSTIDATDNAGDIIGNTILNDSAMVWNLAAGDDKTDLLISGGNTFGVGSIVNLKVSILAADILTIGVTPVELIPAPGAGNFINLIGFQVKYNFVTLAYVSNDLWLIIDTASESISDGFQVLTALADKFIDPGLFSGTVNQLVENKALTITTSDGIDPTTGDGTLEIYLTYQIKTL
jgi:hypothetical protein